MELNIETITMLMDVNGCEWNSYVEGSSIDEGIDLHVDKYDSR